MYKLSEIVGKNVVSLYEAKNTGTLVNVLFDKNLTKIKYFEVFSDEDEDISRKFFSPDVVGAMENDAVVIKNCGKMMSRFSIPPVYVPGPVNAAVYNPSGVALGRVTDVTLDGFSVTEINVGDLSFPPSDVLSKSDEILIINDTGEKIRLTPPAKKVPSAKDAPALTVKAHAAEASREAPAVQYPAEYASAAAVSSAPEAEIQLQPEISVKASALPAVEAAERPTGIDVPKKLSGGNVSVTKTPAFDDNKSLGYAFLLGKLVTRTIYRDDGSILFNEGSYIDEEGIEQAGSANKLVQLALHSK